MNHKDMIQARALAREIFQIEHLSKTLVEKVRRIRINQTDLVHLDYDLPSYLIINKIHEPLGSATRECQHQNACVSKNMSQRQLSL